MSCEFVFETLDFVQCFFRPWVSPAGIDNAAQNSRSLTVIYKTCYLEINNFDL